MHYKTDPRWSNKTISIRSVRGDVRDGNSTLSEDRTDDAHGGAGNQVEEEPEGADVSGTTPAEPHGRRTSNHPNAARRSERMGAVDRVGDQLPDESVESPGRRPDRKSVV